MLDGENHHNDPYDTCGFFRLDKKGSGNPASDWYLEHFNIFLGECGELIADTVGRENVRAIVLGGSFALGEGTISFESGSPIFLSDIDLLVIVDLPEMLFRVLSIKTELSGACEGLIPEARFIGHVEVGAVTAKELSFLPRSPGVYDIRHFGRVLYGNGEVLRDLPDFGAGELDRAEAVILLENRMASLLGYWPGGSPDSDAQLYGFLYQVARVYTDIVTAVLCATGFYLPGYCERWCFLSDNRNNGTISKLVEKSVVDASRKWTVFKMNPSLDILEVTSKSFEVMWLEAAEETLKTWKRCSLYVEGRMAEEHLMPDAASVFRSRNTRMRPVDNLRGWKNLLAGRKLKDKILLTLSRRTGMIRFSPSEVVRMESVMLVEKALREGTGCAVSSRSGGFPYRKGCWTEAAGSCNAAWKKLVFGRSDD